MGSPLKMMLAYISRMRHTVFLVSSLILLMLVYRKTIGGADLTMHALRLRDLQWIDDVMKLEPKSLTETDAMYKFYYYISFPLQGVCRVLKRIGGSWIIRQVDGDKFAFMDSRGCEIHAYDPTVDLPAKLGENIQFTKLGLSNTTSDNMDTLANILEKNSHTDTTIEYL